MDDHALDVLLADCNLLVAAEDVRGKRLTQLEADISYSPNSCLAHTARRQR